MLRSLFKPQQRIFSKTLVQHAIQRDISFNQLMQVASKIDKCGPKKKEQKKIEKSDKCGNNNKVTGQKSLQDKNVAYIGAYGGIGYAFCKEVMKKNVKTLTLIDLCEDHDKFEELQCINPKTKLHFIPLDLSKGKKVIEKALCCVMEKMGSMDVLVNGSAIISEREPKRVIDINLTGLIETTLLAIPLMSKAEGGKGGIIANVASVLGLEPGPFIAIYCSTKHAIIGFTRCCADQHYYNHTGISHLAICPGFTITNMIEKFVGVDTFDYSKPISEKMMKTKRQTAEECAKPMMTAIEAGENGSINICDLGKLQKVKMHQYWKYQFD